MILSEIRILLSISLLSLSSFAQQISGPNKTPTPNLKSDPTLTLKALEVRQALDAVYREIDRAKSYENLRERVAVWTTAADILWKDDPQIARKLLRDAFSLAKDATAISFDKDPPYIIALKNDALQRKLKTEVLLIAQKRDTKLVKELIDSFEEEDVKKLDKLRNSPAVFGSTSFTKRQIASFAAILAKTDPKRAVEYADLSLDFGIPQELNDVFRELLASNSIYARQLFLDATNHFLSDNTLNLYDGLILSGYLNLTRISEEEQEITKKLLAKGLLREQLVWQAIQEGRMTDQMLPGVVLSTSKLLYPLFAKYFPERLGDIETFIRQVSQRLAKPADFTESATPDSQAQDDADALITKAEKEPDDENKEGWYLEASMAFAKKKDFVRALEAASHAKDEIKRKAVENYVRRKQSESLIVTGDLYEAIKVIDKIEEPELRAEITVIFAKKAGDQKKSLLATQVVIDTQKFLEKSFSSISYARAYLWLGSAYTTLDPLIGYDLMGSAIKRANQTTDFIELENTPKIIHFGGKSTQAVMVGNSQGDFRSGFRVLGKQNFIQTLSLAENFENKFLRGVAVLASAAAVLEEESPKINQKLQTQIKGY